MAVSSLMTLGVKAMHANQAALQATGHNIANANVAGYSRQQAEMATSQGQFTGAGFIGRGVDVKTVSRAHDELVTREAAGAASLAAMDEARLTQLARLEGVFRPGEAGLGHAVDQFLNAIVDVSNHPADGAARQVVLARAGDMVSRFNVAGSAIQELQLGVGSDIRAAVAEVNALADAIAQSNQRIAMVNGQGQPPNDLLDERDRLIARLSEKVQVSRVPNADGSVAIFAAGGQRLVLGVHASTLVATVDESDRARTAVGIADGGTVRMLSGTAFGGGSLAGLLRFQNRDLVDGANLIGRMAATVADAVNRQQARGLSLKAQGDEGAPHLFGLGDGFAAASPLQAQPHRTNARDGAGNALGSLTYTVADAALLQAADYEVSVTEGVTRIRRLPDGASKALADGDTVDGVRIAFGNPGPQEGDRFLLQPVRNAAVSLTRLLDDPRDLAAASPLSATAPASNTGTSSLGALTVTTVPLPFPGEPETITFNRLSPPVDGFHYTVTSSLGAAGPVPWNANLPLQGANGYTLEIDGVPADGDVVVVVPTPAWAVASNNGNANALLALRDAALVDGQTATDAWSQAMSDIGVRVQGARSSSDISTAVAEQARAALASASGVNLDEEAARLIQYQQSYQAAAKMLQVAQTLFDVLLQTTSG